MAKSLRKLSLKTWLAVAFAVSIAASLILILLTNESIVRLQNSLVETIELSPDSADIQNGYYSIRVNEDKSISYVVDIVENGGLYDFLGFMLTAIPLLIAATAIFITALLFYKFKLKKPIHALRDGIGYIEKQNLDFSIDYRSDDELGTLCRAFESMREKLNEAFLSLWDEQQKKTLLTRALAHDLRTPLAILKGHNDLVKISFQNGDIALEQLASVNKIMSESIIRMERYLDNVRDMQALDDWELHAQTVSLQDITRIIKAMNVLRNDITLDVEGNGDCSIRADLPLVMRVADNLVHNAMEYANTKVKVTVQAVCDILQVAVTDDGRGFSDVALQQAADAFYRGDVSRSGGHMGLGLSIAKTLCQKHAGSLEWGNNNKGAYVKATFKSL